MSHFSKIGILVFSFAFIAVLFEGCAPTKTLSSDPVVTEEIARRSLDRPAYIVFQNGDTVAGFQVGVRADSTEWYQADSAGKISPEVRYVTPTTDISSISISTPKVFDNMLIGMGAGALIGAIIYGGAKIPNPPGAVEDQSIGDQLANSIITGIGFKGCVIGLGAIGTAFGIESGIKSRTEYINENVNFGNQENWWK